MKKTQTRTNPQACEGIRLIWRAPRPCGASPNQRLMRSKC